MYGEGLKVWCPTVHFTNLTAWKSGGIYLAHESSGTRGMHLRRCRFTAPLPGLKVEKNPRIVLTGANKPLGCVCLAPRDNESCV